MAYTEPGTTVRKQKRLESGVALNATQRFAMIVGIGRPTIEILNEPVTRGLDDSPTDPTLAPANGQDSLTRVATQILEVSSQPGLRDYQSNLDYVLADGKVDWGPQTTRTILRENSVGVDGTYQIVINRPRAGSLVQAVNLSAVNSESVVVGTNASFDNTTDIITITLEKQSLSNSTGNAAGTESNHSLVITGDVNLKFLPANRIPFNQAFDTDKQWKLDPTSGIVLSYDSTDATLPAGLTFTYKYRESYDVAGAVSSNDGTSFILDPVANAARPTLLSTDYLEVDYDSTQDGREPAPGATYYVSYVALKTEDEVQPGFYGPQDRLEFEADWGKAQEFLDVGNQIALAGNFMYTLGTQGFYVAPVLADNVGEWGAALRRTEEIAYDDLIVLSDDIDVQQLTRSLALDRSSPDSKKRTIPWLAASPGKSSGLPGDDSGETIRGDMAALRHERVIYAITKRRDQLVRIDIPRVDGTVESDVPVPVYWANVVAVNRAEAKASPSDSLLRMQLPLIRTTAGAELFSKQEANILAGEGAMILDDTNGSNVRIRDDVTTVSALGDPDEAEISVRIAEDYLVGKQIEPIMDRQIIGSKITDRSFIKARVRNVINDVLAQVAARGDIVSGKATMVEFSPNDPREILWQFEYSPTFTLKRQSGVYTITLS